MVKFVGLYFGLIINICFMTIKEIIDFNKKYSFITAVVDFIKDTDVDYITIKDIKSIDLLCGFGDTEPFYDALKGEDWGSLFQNKWESDGYYGLEIVYRNIPDSDSYQHWYDYEIEDIIIYKYKDDELNYNNTIPFDWDNLEI